MAATGRFDGKVAIVTGAASGIGAATAALLARDGARVWLADIDADAAAKVAERIRAANAIVLDVTSGTSWTSVSRRACEQDGGWDILVNAAGISRGGGPEDVAQATIDGWRRVFAVNVEGTLLGCQCALASMRAGGAIVNVASTAGTAPSPALTAYGASKAAVIQLTASVAAAGAARIPPLRCNSVVPGMTDTPMTETMTQSYRDAWTREIPAARFGAADEVAATIAFLASDDAAYVTGSSYRVDGGLLSRPVIR